MSYHYSGLGIDNTLTIYGNAAVGPTGKIITANPGDIVTKYNTNSGIACRYKRIFFNS